MSDDMFYARVCAERDQFRAELARLQRNEDCVQRLIVWAAENGWNGVDNAKILDSFIIGLFDQLRAELAAAKRERAGFLLAAQALEAWAWMAAQSMPIEIALKRWRILGRDQYGHLKYYYADTPLDAVLAAMEGESK